jgi:hypothetical protein
MKHFADRCKTEEDYQISHHKIKLKTWLKLKFKDSISDVKVSFKHQKSTRLHQKLGFKLQNQSKRHKEIYYVNHQ